MKDRDTALEEIRVVREMIEATRQRLRGAWVPFLIFGVLGILACLASQLLLGANAISWIGLPWLAFLLLGVVTLRVARTLDCKTRELIDGAKRPARLREVPIVVELRQRLRELWMERGRPAEGLVFHDIDGRPLDLDNLRARHFKPALVAAKIDPETRPFRIYDLRHGFATAALEAGADPVVVRDLMGHSTVRTAQDTYQHPDTDQLERAARSITDELG